MEATVTGERRWIILAEDGRHVTVGRHTDPTPEEIGQAGSQLCALGVGGWLAVLEGGYYRPRDGVTLLMIREIAPTHGTTWDEAADSFQRIRNGVLSPA